MESKELRIGRAGQHLTMCDLLSKGFACCQTEEGMPYDIIVDLGVRMVRIQVKTTEKPGMMNDQYKVPTYRFNVRRAGRGGKREYQIGEFEGFALVCMDDRSVWYYPFTKSISKTLIFRVPGATYFRNCGHIAPLISEFTSDRFFLGFSGDVVDHKHLETIGMRENVVSPEMRAVMSLLASRGGMTIDDVYRETGIAKCRARQILSRKAVFRDGEWHLSAE